jgi:hypothetical protein
MNNPVSFEDYCAHACDKLGAIECRADYYPAGHHQAATVFAYRFFNADKREVAYFLPDVGAFHPFLEPRHWPFHAFALLPQVKRL